MFWILVILSFAAGDKLDRTYLPPPGAKFAGGSPGIIRVPLEYPKPEYSKSDLTTKPEIAVGIDRVGPKQVLNSYEEINTSNAPLTYTDKSYTTPTTAYTQTTPSQYNRDIVYSDFPKNNSFNLQNSDLLQENPNQNTYTDPVTDLFNEQNYPQQYKYGNKISNLQPVVIKQDDASNSFPFNVESQSGGDVDSIIGNTITCNNSVTTNTLIDLCRTFKHNNQNFPTSTPSIYQDITVVTPSSVISKNNNLPSLINDSKSNYHSTTPTIFASSISPTSNDYSLFKLATMRPERIQAQADREAVILNYENVITPEGYVYSFDTSNGIHGDETGITLNGVRAKGSYSYVGDDGKLYKVVYTADENGFQPQGDHLPTAPPIPDAILKVIEKAYQDKETGVSDDGSYDENKYGYKKYEKAPFGQQNLIKQVKSNGDLNTKTDFGTNPSYTKNFFETPITSNRNSYSNVEKVFSGDYTPPTNNYEFKELPQSVKNLVKTKLDVDDLATRDDVLNYIQKNQKLASTVTGNPTTDSVLYAQKKIYSTTPSYEATTIEPYTETGYQYFRPSTIDLNKFPTRFTEIKNPKIENEIQKQKTTPKPFMTPYVSRNDDETQNLDSDENVNQATQPIIYGINQQNYNKYPDIQQKGNVKEGINYYSDDEGMKNGDNNGYNYQKYEEPHIQFTGSKPTFVPTASTVVPKEFSPRLSTALPINQYDTGLVQATSRPNLFVPSVESRTENKISFLPNYSKVLPDFINHYEMTDSPNNYYTYKSSSEQTSDVPEEASPIPNFKVSYSPNIDTTAYPDVSIPQQSSENIIGEDFRGPKRPQSFDPLTGYHY